MTKTNIVPVLNFYLVCTQKLIFPTFTYMLIDITTT